MKKKIPPKNEYCKTCGQKLPKKKKVSKTEQIKGWLTLLMLIAGFILWHKFG